MKSKKILSTSEVERKLNQLLHTYTTRTKLRNDIKQILAPYGIVRKFDPGVVPQICDAYETEFELDFGDGINYYYIQVYYTKCRTRKIFTVEIGVEE